jgi:hypothetical protein
MPEKTKKRKLIGKYKMIDGKLVYDTRADKFRRDHMPYLKYKEPFHNDGFKRFYGTEDEMNKAPGKKKADIYTGRTIRRKKSKDTQRQRRYNPNNPPESVDPDVPRKLKAKAGGIMKVKRLKSGGFVSSGTDAGDLQILRTAKNIDDGSANGMKAGGKVKKSRVNEAGNYTKPGLRKRIFNRIKAGGKGGRPGQWSARKAQMMAKAYKKAGGGYK